MIEFIGKENVHLNTKQLDELIELIDKEEILEVEDKIEKALQKEKETKSAEAAQQPATESPKDSKQVITPEVPVIKPEAEKSASSQQPEHPTKPKVETQSTLVTPPPVSPVSSIDTNKPKDSSKNL